MDSNPCSNSSILSALQDTLKLHSNRVGIAILRPAPSTLSGPPPDLRAEVPRGQIGEAFSGAVAAPDHHPENTGEGAHRACLGCRDAMARRVARPPLPRAPDRRGRTGAEVKTVVSADHRLSTRPRRGGAGL